MNVVGTDEDGRPQLWYILDDQGTPVPARNAREWGDWMNAAHVERLEGKGDRIDTLGLVTDLPTGERVYTTFQGYAGEWEGGDPILWETVVLRPGDPMVLLSHQRRYPGDRDTAGQVHASTVASLS